MTKLESRFSVADVEILSRQNCHEGFLRIEKLHLKHRLFAGGWSEDLLRELLVKDEAVGVLLYDPGRDEVVLVRQFRTGAIVASSTPWMLELVAGIVGEGEELERVAIRESTEEADCVPTDLCKICDYLNSPGASNEKVTLFCGRIDSSGAGGVFGLTEEHEDIEVVVLAFSAALAAVESGEIHNAMSIIAIQWLALHKQEIRELWK
ncbi:MAG: NUDIX domain-containing protein [Proteobacteria bacterium]|nr:NUDIX domain-containing protein [Pseudomonadota bacterium]